MTTGGVHLTTKGQPKPVEVKREVKLLYLGNAMILRQDVGTGKLGDEDVKLTLALSQPVGSLIVGYKGRYVGIDIEDFINVAAEIIDGALSKEA